MLISYLLTYLSNENQEAVDVHFDDFAIYHGMSKVAQIDDYYPFGLTFNSYYGGVENRFRFNGMEINPATQIYETMFRGYDPSIGRFTQIDPLSDFLPGITNYNFAFNNPIGFVDPKGLMGQAGNNKDRFRKFVTRIKNNTKRRIKNFKQRLLGWTYTPGKNNPPNNGSNNGGDQMIPEVVRFQSLLAKVKV